MDRYNIILNIVLAFIWCLLQQKIDIVELITGGLFGFFILYLFREIIDERKDERRDLRVKDCPVLIIHTIKYIFIFLYELIKANLQLVRIVLSPRIKIRPGIIVYRLGVKTEAGITLLANSITLTPGTLTIDISPDKKRLYIHTIDMENSREMEESIRSSLERYSRRVLE